MIPALLILLSVAQATGLHTGVPVMGIEGLGHPRFQTVDTGWMASVPNGFIRVYVGATTADAERWVTRHRKKLAQHTPTPHVEYAETPSVDEAYGDGVKLLMFRSKNVAVCSRSTVDATIWADAILGSIVAIPAPWPKPPGLSIKDQHWVIEAQPNTQHVSFVGGSTGESPTLQFTKPPYRLIGWDSWGRAAWTEVAVP